MSKNEKYRYTNFFFKNKKIKPLHFFLSSQSSKLQCQASHLRLLLNLFNIHFLFQFLRVHSLKLQKRKCQRQLWNFLQKAASASTCVEEIKWSQKKGGNPPSFQKTGTTIVGLIFQSRYESHCRAHCL